MRYIIFNFIVTVMSVFISISVNAKSDSYCNVRIQVLGAGGPEIDDGLASSSFLVWHGEKAKVMIDAGGGSSLIFEKSKANFNDIEAILFTHLHVDHSSALPVYIKAGYFTGREKKLKIFGPLGGGGFPSTESFVESLFDDRVQSVYPYLSDNYYQQVSTDFLVKAKSITPLKKHFFLNLTDDITIEAISVVHGAIPALAWRVNINGCSATFSGDMNGSNNNLQKLAKGTDLLVANNAIPQDAGGVAKKLHMTPLKVGEIAVQSKVKKLLLAHFMNRTLDSKEETRKHIKQNFNGQIIFAEELSFVELE